LGYGPGAGSRARRHAPWLMILRTHPT